jgi:hypothetical protein
MHEGVMNVQEVRPCRLGLMAKKQCVREIGPDQIRELFGEGDHCRVAADRNNDVSAVELDQLPRFLRAISYHDRVEAPAPQRVRQTHRLPKAILVS